MSDGLKKNRQLKEGKKLGKGMAERPKAFCLWMLSDRRNTLSFMTLHLRFFKRAEELLAAEHNRKLMQAEQDDLRQFGTLAAMAAIWLWIAPLRITNMLELTISGAQQKLHLPEGKRNYAMLLIPSDQTKTGRPIRKKVYPNRSRALEVLDFYVKHIRPKHPHAVESPLLFPGYDSPTSPVGDTAVRSWLKVACQAVGFYPISPHWFRHGIASTFLKHNPGAYTHAGRMLDDTPRTVRNYYAFIDEEHLHNESQIEMLRIAGFADEDPHAMSRIKVKR